MRAALYGKVLFTHVAGISLFMVFFCVVIQAQITCAAADEGSTVHDRVSTTYLLQAKIEQSDQSGVAYAGNGISGQSTQHDVFLEESVDTESDLEAADVGSASPVTSAKLEDGDGGGIVIARETAPATPPPDKISLPIDYTTLIAATSNSTPKDAEKNTPAPNPKTSKSSSISTTAMIAAGAAVAVGVAVGAGGGSSSDSDSGTSPGSGTTSTPPTSSAEVIHLSDLVRIGDDSDYNAHHPDKFKVSHPSGTSWTDSFSIDNFNSVRSARFKYTVAASKVGNPVFINGRQAGRLCNPGNTAWNVESCSINITGYIRAGSNEIKIVTKTDPSDTVSPLDDVELYNLLIELTR